MHPLMSISKNPKIVQLIEQSSESLAKVHRHRANRRDTTVTAGVGTLRYSKASALIGDYFEENQENQEEIITGAFRAYDSLDSARADRLNDMTAIFVRAPFQAIAKIHILAASSLTNNNDSLGKPRNLDNESSQRLSMIADLITTPLKGASVGVLSAIVHAELMVIKPFEISNGIVARATSRLVSATFGLDTHNIGLPELFWLKKRKDYFSKLDEYSKATSEEPIIDWIEFHLMGLNYGAGEALKIAEASLS